ncbi:hypothetical protein SAMN04488038_1193 [Solimonas aquatica]|uniref:Uncharacterized protein n=1 Tax=Solimonas aquatica TaxID=489703 RepID=A0A1H9M4P8_9GAMM|nr:hypothetical protein [Solimonas aquatica]SER18654.1 hypothetical protein SAMN04488038_1193 [Solimonas aquatica]
MNKLSLALSAMLLLCTVARAGAATDPQREEMQRTLNAQTMASPFNAGDIKKAQEYAEDALKKNIPPPAQPPAYWQPGWSCASLAGYAYYSYYDYRDCVYYHRYYGHYW